MNNKKYIFRSLLCVAAAASLVACDNDDLYLGAADTDVLGGADGNVIYVTDALGNSDDASFTFTGSGTFNLYAHTSKAIAGNCSVTFNYDVSALTDYNTANGTDYEAVAPDMVVFSNNGVASLSAGALKSAPLAVTVNGQGKLDPDKVYALPLSFTVANGSAVGGDNKMVVLVRDTSSYPGADKTFNGAPGMKLIAAIEVNGNNPLNALSFMLKDSGKQMFDMVVFFSANINYDSQTNRVYVSRNENVQALLDNRDKYIKPFQDRGVKVILGILGNHDESGISTLSDEACKEFAQEVKNVCDAYQLDGVFLDDEYTNWEAAKASTNPKFRESSYEAASRMAYEIKKAQPERLVISYKWERLYSAVAIDGHQPGEFFDYVVNDYCDTENPVNTYPGLRQDQAGTGSWNCSDGNWVKARWFPGMGYNFSDGSQWFYDEWFPLAGMREEGYGAMLVYNFDVRPDSWLTPYIVDAMKSTAKELYNGELQYDGSYFPKDY
ncbi:MAG: DUF1735 domain-containing protein [Muribaculaceae bacterium]|jgi:hypothetical protein|nr:DUF1735 domain-containing protein [Muribaculaceae bacterium]